MYVVIVYIGIITFILCLCLYVVDFVYDVEGKSDDQTPNSVNMDPTPITDSDDENGGELQLLSHTTSKKHMSMAYKHNCVINYVEHCVSIETINRIIVI